MKVKVINNIYEEIYQKMKGFSEEEKNEENQREM